MELRFIAVGYAECKYSAARVLRYLAQDVRILARDLARLNPLSNAASVQ